MEIIWIILVLIILALIILFILFSRLRSEGLPIEHYHYVIPEKMELIFKGKEGKDDWIIKRVDNRLITGIKKGSTIIQKSVI